MRKQQIQIQQRLSELESKRVYRLFAAAVEFLEKHIEMVEYSSWEKRTELDFSKHNMEKIIQNPLEIAKNLREKEPKASRNKWRKLTNYIFRVREWTEEWIKIASRKIKKRILHLNK